MDFKKITFLGLAPPLVEMGLEVLRSNKLSPDIVIYCHLLSPYIFSSDFNITHEKFRQNVVPPYFVCNYEYKKKLEFIRKIGCVPDDCINLIHATAHLSFGVTLGKNIIINPLVAIAGNTKIGNYVTINRGVTIGHDVFIGDYTTINPGVNIGGNTTIGAGSLIGMGATIFNKLNIGRNVTIGGGSVVTKNIPDNALAYGNPCKIIKLKTDKNEKIRSNQNRRF